MPSAMDLGDMREVTVTKSQIIDGKPTSVYCSKTMTDENEIADEFYDAGIWTLEKTLEQIQNPIYTETYREWLKCQYDRQLLRKP